MLDGILPHGNNVPYFSVQIRVHSRDLRANPLRLSPTGSLVQQGQFLTVRLLSLAAAVPQSYFSSLVGRSRTDPFPRHKLLEVFAASTSVGRTSGLPVDACSEGVDLRCRRHLEPAGQRPAPRLPPTTSGCAPGTLSSGFLLVRTSPDSHPSIL